MTKADSATIQNYEPTTHIKLHVNHAFVDEDVEMKEQQPPTTYDTSGDTDTQQRQRCDTTELLSLVGGYGWFQRILNIMMMLLSIPASFHLTIMCFIARKSDWRCNEGSAVCLFNGTLPSTDARRCDMPRDAWVYAEGKDYSVVTQFDVICNKEWLVSFSTTLFFVAWMLGAVFMGWLSDNFGRKRTIFGCQIAVLGVTFASAFVPNFYLFLVCRMAIGFFCPGTFPQMFILMSEIVTDKYRALAGVSIFTASSFGAGVLCLKAYLIPNWRDLTIFCSAPYSILLLCYFFVPESVAFHRVKGRVDKAMKTLHRMTVWNRTHIPHGVVLSPTSRQPTRRHTSPIDLFRTKKMAILTTIQSYAWFACGVAYTGLFLAAEDLDGGLYRDFIMMTIGEVVGNIVILILMTRLGRKTCVNGSILVGALICIALGFTPAKNGLALMRLLFGILGKASLTAGFNALHTWSVELFPTNVRGEAMGLLQVAVRIGTGCSPWVANELKKIHPCAPFVTIGVSSLLGFFVMFYLPETKGNKIVDSNDEIDEKVRDNGKQIAVITSSA